MVGIDMSNDIRIVIFDVDDTLIYTIDTAYKKTNMAGKKAFNLELDKSDFIELYGKYNFEDCIKYWYKKEEIDEFVNEYNSIKMEYEYIGDIERIITSLKHSKILVGVVTNSTKEKTERKLKKYIDLFDFVYVDAEKPNTKCIDNIIKRYSVKKNEIVLIGDSENDYNVSKNSGINFCGVNTGKKKWNTSNVIFIESIRDLIKGDKIAID